MTVPVWVLYIAFYAIIGVAAYLYGYFKARDYLKGDQ